MLGCLTSFTVFSGDIKKSSENDQLTGHFQSFFIQFFHPPEPKSEKNARKSTNKKFLALFYLIRYYAQGKLLWSVFVRRK